MKESGIDGLSRGDLLEGMMAGKDPLSFLPLDKGAGQRSQGRVQEWIRSWWTDGEGKAWQDQPLHELKPEDWFSLHENPNPRLWIPPPAAMETVVEMFNEDRLDAPTFLMCLLSLV